MMARSSYLLGLTSPSRRLKRSHLDRQVTTRRYQNLDPNILILKRLRISKKVLKTDLEISKIIRERKSHFQDLKPIGGRIMDLLRQAKRKRLFRDQRLCQRVLASLMGNLRIASDQPVQSPISSLRRSRFILIWLGSSCER